MDLSALKQEIQDDAGLLSNWRKAYPWLKKKQYVASEVVERSFCFSNKQKGDVVNIKKLLMVPDMLHQLRVLRHPILYIRCFIVQ